MKKSILLFMFLGLFISMNAQDLQRIELNAPSKNKGVNIMEAFANRQSVREYSDKALSMQELSDLLWATIGINRPESGKTTAPTANNKQEISVYVTSAEGTYLYNAKENALIPVVKTDLRPLLAMKQTFVLDAPIALIITADLTKLGGATEGSHRTAAMDAGIVSQNISLFCAGTGLATVCRGWMDANAVKEALKLPETQVVLLNHPIGFAK